MMDTTQAATAAHLLRRHRPIRPRLHDHPHRGRRGPRYERKCSINDFHRDNNRRNLYR
jgi:hypothetical protein